jgi:hypothetical protein
VKKKLIKTQNIMVIMIKKITIMPFVSRLPMLLILVLVLWSCDRARTDKGYEYFPDMAHSLAYETYTDNDVFDGGLTMLLPAVGTIPRNMIPYKYADINRDLDHPGVELENPLIINQKVLLEGEYLYGIFCAQCHGIKGDGQGNLYTSGKYVIPPKALIDEEALEDTGGQIYHVISEGYGVMGQHASLILPEDRWKIVAYVEKIIQKK